MKKISITEEDVKEAVYKCLKKIIREGMDYDEDDNWYWVITSKPSMRKDLNGRKIYHKRYILNAAYATSTIDAERIIYGTLKNGWEIECSFNCNIEHLEWLNNKWRKNKNIWGELESENFIKNIKEINNPKDWRNYLEKTPKERLAKIFGINY